MLSPEDDLKYIHAIIRKPQSGKTFICLKSIAKTLNMMHIILTMNTILSNDQFTDRCQEFADESSGINEAECEKIFKDKYIIFNSRNTKEKSHVKTVTSLKNEIVKNDKIIVIMCAHPKRFKNSILELLEELKDSRSFNKKIVIHIDEAHAYVEKHRKHITEWNNYEIVDHIRCYTATHLKLWKDEHSLWNNLYIIDVQEQYNIVKNDKYFGVKDAEIINFTDVDQFVDTSIPQSIIDHCTPTPPHKSWYTQETKTFANGDEYSYMCFLRSVLTHIKTNNSIQNDKFTYNFIPAYNRVVSHLGIAYEVSRAFPNALIVIFNGNKTIGHSYYYKKEYRKLPFGNEISEKIQTLRQSYPNIPIFITGFTCVSMSVTLINQNIGNFDNMIMSHEQYDNQPDILYQMCRFLFSYKHWHENNINIIKKTKIYCRHPNIIDKCIKYEQIIENIEDNLSGSLRTSQEVQGGLKPSEIKKKPKKDECIEKYATCKIKTFTIDDIESDKDTWNKIEKFYKEITGKKITTKSIPDIKDGFYICSTTGKAHVHHIETFRDDGEGKSRGVLHFWRPTSNFQLCPNTYKYIRLYIGYENLKCPTKYTVYARYLILEENEIVKNHLETKRKPKPKIK